MTKAEAPERVPAGQLHAGDDIVILGLAAHIAIATHGSTGCIGRAGRNIVVLHCEAANGREFPEVLFAEAIVTRTHAATQVAA